MNDGVRRDDLAGPRERAQPCGEIQRTASVAVTDPYRLAGVHADADPSRQLGGRELGLQLQGRPQGLARGREDDQRLVAAQLDQLPPSRHDHGRGDLGEPCGQRGRRLVALLAGEGRVAADVGNQHRPDVGTGRRRLR